jgi:hypothetical protein
MATKRVIAKKDSIRKAIKEFDQIKFYPVPQFEKNGVIPNFKIKMASLDDQIKAHELSQAPNRLLIRLLKSMKDNEEVDYDEFRKQLYYDDLHPKTLQVCDIFHRCVLQPKFKITEVMELAETHPELVNDIAAFALGVEEEGEEDGRRK